MNFLTNAGSVGRKDANTLSLGVTAATRAVPRSARRVASHYGDGKLEKQGTDKRLPFFRQLGLSASYGWKIDRANDLSLQLKITDVTNRKGVINLDEVYDTGQLVNGAHIESMDHHATTWLPPRATSLVLRYACQ